MKLLMISGDRSILAGKKGAFWYTLEEFSKYWERVDVITPRAPNGGWRAADGGKKTESTIRNSQFAIRNPFPNVYFHPSNTGLLQQSRFILKKGVELFNEHRHDVMTTHEYPPFYNGKGAWRIHRATGIAYMTEIHHIVGYPKAASLQELIGRWMSRVWLPRWGTKDAAAVRTVSEGTARTLVEWGISKEKISVTSSLYLDSSILAVDSSIPKTHSVAFCGRLVANKGLLELVRAVAMLPDASLLVIGDGPLRKRAQRLARSLRVHDRVTFTGWLPESRDVYRAMQSAKIFVMNSKSEGGPRVLFEAMALGLPVISTHVGAAPSFIRDGDNGFFTVGKPADLSAKISRLLADEALRRSVGEKATEILAAADRSTNVRAYADSLKKIIPSKPSPHP